MKIIVKTTKHLILSFVILIFHNLTAFSQYFPPSSSLITGQGPIGSLDPVWSVSQNWFPALPSAADLAIETFSPALINNSCAPGAWVNPATLPFPNNQSNWITGADVNCANNIGSGFRAFRMSLNLPPDCNGVSVTQVGTYILNLIAFADNSISEVYVNGNTTGISGGNYSPTGGVNITLSGPWMVGNNTIEIVLLNDWNNGAINPYGLLVTSNATTVTDTDNDGIADNVDLCPCTPGNNNLGCITNTFGCDLDLIENNVLNAGLIPLHKSNTPCKLYYLDPNLQDATTALAAAESINGNLVIINSQALSNSLFASIQEINPITQAYIGLSDVAAEGTFIYPDGGTPTYYNWNVGEPNNVGDEDCVEMLQDGTWNDIPCTTLRNAIYEIDLCPSLTISPPIEICENTPVTIDAMVQYGSLTYTYEWNTGAITPSVTVMGPATVSVIIHDENLCHDTTETTIILFPSEPKGITSDVTSLNANANGDSIYVLCEGNSIELTAFGGSGYTWSNGMANGTSNAPGLGTSILTAYFTNIHGCQDSVKAEIQVNPLPNVQAGVDSTVCFGDPYILNATGAVTYIWSNGQANGANFNQVIGTTTQLIVTGTDVNACTNTDTVFITIHSLPTVAVDNTSICNGESAILTASGAVDYSWSPTTDLNTTIGTTVISSSTTTINYTVTGTDANGCASSSDATVTILALPTAVLIAPTSICEGRTANLAGSGGTSYEWLAPISLVGTTNPIVSHSPTATTTYTLVAVNAAGCSDTISSTVVVHANPIIDVNSGTICNGASINLNASGAVDYVWTPAATLSNSTGATVAANPNTTTVYQVTGTDANNCFSSASATVTVNPLPSVQVNSVTICNGELATLTANGAVDYSWSPATDLNTTFGASVISSSTTTINYTVTGTDANGCVNDANSTITISPNPTLTLPDDQTICYGEQVSLDASSDGIVDWAGFPNHTELTPGIGTHIYIATATSANGCVITEQFTVNVMSIPEADFNISPDSLDMYTPEITFTNTSTGGFSYDWSFGDGASDTVENPTHTYSVDPLTNHTVTLIVVSQFGCLDSLTKTLSAKNTLVHFVPNSFSPNGDEYNHIFLPIMGPGYDRENYTLYIYSRWGEVLFESKDIFVGWDGTFRGQMCPLGTYVWKIRVKEIGTGRSFDYVGSVNLIR